MMQSGDESVVLSPVVVCHACSVLPLYMLSISSEGEAKNEVIKQLLLCFWTLGGPFYQAPTSLINMQTSPSTSSI